MPSFFDLQKFAATGIASADMTAYDKARALAEFGGGKTRTLTGVPPLSFVGNGKPLISWSMKGNGSQTGTPTPDNPVMPTFCGKLVGTDWTVPITCAGQTVPVYLGQTQTVRRIKKQVLTGDETWWASGTYKGAVYAYQSQFPGIKPLTPLFCTHLVDSYVSPYVQGTCKNDVNSVGMWVFDTTTSPTYFKSYLAQQYANGTPVTVWYVLAEPETAIVNEPLAKIGNYADELHSTDAGVSIPTVKGQNTLTVDTTVQPSSMTVNYKV